MYNDFATNNLQLLNDSGTAYLLPTPGSQTTYRGSRRRHYPHGVVQAGHLDSAITSRVFEE